MLLSWCSRSKQLRAATGPSGEEFTARVDRNSQPYAWVDGPIGYSPAPGDDGILDGSYFAIDGSSMSYSGPMLKQPTNDGSNPPPIDVGTGTISATCG